MSTPKIAPIGNNTKLYITSANEHVTFETYVAENATEHSIPAALISNISRFTKAGEDFELPDELPKAQKKAAKAFSIQAKSDFAAHKKNKAIVEKNDAEAQAKRAKEKADAEAADAADLAESTEEMAKALGSKALVKVATQLTDGASKLIQQSMPEGIELDASGLVTVAEGLSKTQYAEAFAALVKANEAGGKITDRSAKTEAQVALSAKTTLGEGWVNLLKVNNQADLDRIKKGIKTVEVCFGSTAGKNVFLALPLSTTRALTEFKVTTPEEAGSKEKAAEENLAAKLDVLKLAAATIKKVGADALTQTVAKNLVSEYKASKGIEGKVRFKYFYGVADEEGAVEIYGTAELSAHLLKLSTFMLDYNGNRYENTKEGIKSQPITGPTEELLEQMRELEEAAAAEKDKAAAKKTAAKKTGKGKSAEDKKKDADDEEADDEPAPVKKKVVAKAPAKKAPVVEDDDSDEDSDDDSDDDSDEDETPAPKKKGKPVVEEDDSDVDEADDDESDDDDSDDDDSDDD